jgi:hypothetical protein
MMVRDTGRWNQYIGEHNEVRLSLVICFPNRDPLINHFHTNGQDSFIYRDMGFIYSNGRLKTSVYSMDFKKVNRCPEIICKTSK